MLKQYQIYLQQPENMLISSSYKHGVWESEISASKFLVNSQVAILNSESCNVDLKKNWKVFLVLCIDVIKYF